MYYYDFKKYIISIFVVFAFIFAVWFGCGTKSNAMEVTHYSYEDIEGALDDKYHKEEFFYKENGRSYICFATYNGNKLRTTVKKKANINKLLYCVNYNNIITFHKNFTKKNDLFNNELRVRIGIALYYAPTKWNQKANSKFTTGNFILDYYMTQIVIHSLINKYGGDKANYGIDFSKVQFKDGTGNLEKKTKALYQYCCDADVIYKNGNFQSVEFNYIDPTDQYMYLQDDYFVSSTVDCNIATNNAEVSGYSRAITSSIISDNEVATLESNEQTYNSSFRVKTARNVIDELSPDLYEVTISENVKFARKIAGFWKCSESGYEDTNQEVGELITEYSEVSDQVSFQVLVGGLVLYKKDSVTGEPISDATFQILQYNSDTQQYEFCKDMTYNTELQRYESGNLYLTTTNKEGKFQVVETKAGANYILDWAGQYFEITPDTYIHEIHVENQPVLGKLEIKKSGERWTFRDSNFDKTQTIPLANVKFALYANEDIYVKGNVFYAKGTKIADLVTDQSGTASVKDLPMGKYYIHETQTLNDYILDETIHYFEITRDSTRKYNDINYTFSNKLKTVSIELFKYYFDKDDIKEKNEIPLEGAKFGLYLKNDLCDTNGTVILSKDTCIKESYSNKDGVITFTNLPYAEYYVKELEAPDGFVVNDGIVLIQLKDFTYDDDKKVYNCKKDIVNTKHKYIIRVQKTADAFVGYREETSIAGNYFNYEIGSKQLENVSFSLYNMDNELIDTQTTDAKGIAEFTDLNYGKYYLVESSTPAEYKMIETGKEITCEMNNTEYNIISPPIIEEQFYNELCECSVQLSKYGEYAIVKDESIAYEQIPLSNVVFGIYQNFDYTFSNNNILKQGSCVGYIITDTEGKGTYTGKLPGGDYYLREISTQPGYELDITEYPFKVVANANNNISISFDNENALINRLSKASVQIIKTDANTNKKLKNVEFTLYNDKSEKIGVYKTNKNGIILVENLPYGKYYFIETKAKKGYYSSNNKYHFTLETDELITLNITNSPILKLGFEENYKWWLLGIGIVFILFLFMLLFDHNQWNNHKQSTF